jgi:hypothetical protein
MVFGKESGEEIFLEILKPKSFRIRILLKKSKDDGRSWNVYVRYGFIGFLWRISGKGSYFRWTFLR